MTEQLIQIHEGLANSNDNNIRVKAEKSFHPDPSKGREGSVPIYCQSKSQLIDELVRSFVRTGSAFEGIVSPKEAVIDRFMCSVRDWVIEQELKHYVFRYHKMGEKLIALTPDVISSERRIIVKLAKPNVNFEKKVAYGYGLLKRYLGPVQKTVLAAPTSICEEIALNVRDIGGIPQLVSFKGIIQKRVIVAEDIFERLGGTLDSRRSEIEDNKRSFFKRQREARLDPVMEAAMKNEKKIARDYAQWNIEAAKVGLYDKDTLRMMKNRKFSPDRNYGYDFPPAYKPIDWGLRDFLMLKKEDNLALVGFDGDDFEVTDSFRGKTLRANRVPDVYEREIKIALEKALDKILIKK